MIFRRKLPEVDLTEDAYARWLRAQSPPFEWFLGQAPEVQETLASLGDDYVLGEPETEADLVQQMVAGFAEKLQAGHTPQRPMTMGGTTERQTDKDNARQVDRNKGRSFMGRKPDEVKA